MCLGHRAVVSILLCASAGCGNNSVDQTVDGGTEPPRDSGPLVILDGGGGIASPPDGAAACPPGACNYQTQQGCSATEACRPVLVTSTVAPHCERAGSGESGAPCSSMADCARGYFCADNVCRKLCCGGDWSACPEGESCLRSIRLGLSDGGDSVDTGAELCFPVGDCDVLDPASCADQPGRACQIVDPVGHVACAPEGNAGQGERCASNNPCVRGFFCVGGACRRLCRAVLGGGQPSCPTNEGICVHFNRDPVGVGECTP
jgi:hypothetical protein